MQPTTDYTESNRYWPSVFYWTWQRLIWASVVAWVERLDYRNRATEFGLRMSCTTSKSSRSFYRIRMRSRSLMQWLSQFRRPRFRLVAKDMCSSHRFDRTQIGMRRSCDRTGWGGSARSRSIWTLFLCLMMLMRMRSGFVPRRFVSCGGLFFYIIFTVRFDFWFENNDKNNLS